VYGVRDRDRVGRADGVGRLDAREVRVNWMVGRLYDVLDHRVLDLQTLRFGDVFWLVVVFGFLFWLFRSPR
jgi:hypothetical protein